MFRWSRDFEYVGVTPGLLPAAGQDAQVRRVQGGKEWKGQVAVRFEPPTGVSPALAGTVVDGKVDPRDIGAMLIDLSLRGWFRIGKEGEEWVFTPAATQPVNDRLTAAEADLLNGIFHQDGQHANLPGVPDNAVTMTMLKQRLRGRLRHVTDGLYSEVRQRGWYENDPRDKGFLGLRGRSPRTADGTAVRIQTMGFQKYLATAEAKQIKFEEAAGLFSRYLPYAMVFGLAAQWAAVIGEVARQAQLEGLGDVLGGVAADPFFWMFYGDDLAYLGVEAVSGLADLLSDGGGIFDAAELAGGLGDVFGSLSDMAGDIFGDVGDFFDL